MLSDREILILKLLEEGKTHKQISKQLGLSKSTVAHRSGEAKRKQRLPPQSYERLLSNRAIHFLHRTCGPDEVAPVQIRKWLLDGTLRLYGHNLVTFKGVKTRNAGRKTFLDLCDYAGIDAAELRQLKSVKVFPPSESMINNAITVLERAGYKITTPEAGVDSDHQPPGAGQGGEDNTGDRTQYVVYLSKGEESDAKPGPQRFSTMDEAARACISLSEQGYKILRVRLPSGNYVTGPQINWAISIGISGVKIALGR